MKTVALPIILTALTLHATAFFGIWTAPGLEFLPTLESLTKADSSGKTRKSLIIPTPSDHNWLAQGVTPE